MSGYADRNWCVVQNDLFAFSLTLRDSDGDPIDLTGASVRMQVRADFGDPVVALEFEIGDGITVPTPADGRADFSKIAALAPRGYVYDVEFNFGAGPRTMLRGQIRVLPEVTVDAP